MDYAYAKHRIGLATVTAGQMTNPFLTTWILWDSDVRPAGLTIGVESNGFFATGGGYVARSYGWNDSQAKLGALQVGYRGTSGGFSYTAAGAAFLFNHATVDPNVPAGQPHPVPAIADERYDFHLGTLYGNLTYARQDWKGSLFAEAIHNFAADGAISQVGGMPAGTAPEGQDTAWLLGASLRWKRLTLSYEHARIEADAVWNQINDSTFGAPFGSTDVAGHVIGTAYELSPNLALTTKTYLVEPIERTDRDGGRVYTINAVWKY